MMSYQEKFHTQVTSLKFQTIEPCLQQQNFPISSDLTQAEKKKPSVPFVFQIFVEVHFIKILFWRSAWEILFSVYIRKLMQIPFRHKDCDICFFRLLSVAV